MFLSSSLVFVTGAQVGLPEIRKCFSITFPEILGFIFTVLDLLLIFLRFPFKNQSA